MSKKPNSDAPPSGRRLRTPRLFRNWISMLGILLSVSAVFAFILLFAIDLMAETSNPYMGILCYLIAPFFFFSGCGLMLIGYWLQRRHRKKTKGKATPLVLSIDLSRKSDQKRLIGFALVSVGFLLITAFGSYQSYHTMETVSFCGKACHEPMEPQFVAYQHSPHAHVACAECHVGSGATAYVKTKINGMRQLYHQTMGDFSRPIVLHDREKRPTQETCEKCHWRESHVGTVAKTFRYYLADEENTPWTIRMQINVGGGDPAEGKVSGVHWHMNIANQIEFISTDDGQEIPWVRMTDIDGKVTEFKTPDFDGNIADHTIKKMDCMDCHNRAAHQFKSPNEAVDRAMTMGKIDPTMPWAKMKAVKALTDPYADSTEALAKIDEYLRAEYPDDKRVETLVTEVQSIYKKNFFPGMKADWRAYPDNLSHKNWAGCFRCHDGNHKATTGDLKIKASDCTSCHIITSQGSTVEELAKYTPKGLDFLHIDSEYEDYDCAECHTGGNQEE
ncbi:MAG: NapC/NirT family cytochrome c [Akkermansiaceae bacterium]|nr:NapC/NirT family cytochrome c [Akkermansiaceae bacterium]